VRASCRRVDVSRSPSCTYIRAGRKGRYSWALDAWTRAVWRYGNLPLPKPVKGSLPLDNAGNLDVG
jgi:hypothetical protein